MPSAPAPRTATSTAPCSRAARLAASSAPPATNTGSAWTALPTRPPHWARVAGPPRLCRVPRVPQGTGDRRGGERFRRASRRRRGGVGGRQQLGRPHRRPGRGRWRARRARSAPGIQQCPASRLGRSSGRVRRARRAGWHLHGQGRAQAARLCRRLWSGGGHTHHPRLNPGTAAKYGLPAAAGQLGRRDSEDQARRW